MSSGNLATIFQWVAIILGAFGVMAQGSALYFRNIASAESAAEIARLKGRVLTPAQRAKFVETLGAPPPAAIIINHRLMDGEGNDFATQIADAFRLAGWNLGNVAGNLLMENPGFIVVKTIDPSMSEAADRIRRALDAVGIVQRDIDIPSNRIGGTFLAGHIYVIVGRK